MSIEEGNTSTRSAPSSNRTWDHIGPDLGGVSRAAKAISHYTGGTSAAPALRAESPMKRHSDVTYSQELSTSQSSSGCRLYCKRALVISIAIFIIIMIAVFLRIANIVDLFGPILPTFI